MVRKRSSEEREKRAVFFHFFSQPGIRRPHCLLRSRKTKPVLISRRPLFADRRPYPATQRKLRRCSRESASSS